MISVGIDVSKEKSTVCILKPYGEIVSKPFEVYHVEKELSELATMLLRLNDEVRIIMEATGFFIVFRNFITDRYPRVTRQRKQIQTFVGAFIMDYEHNVCTLSFFIRPKNSHIQLDIPSQHSIQQIQIGTAAHISAKGRFARHLVISEGCAAR